MNNAPETQGDEPAYNLTQDDGAASNVPVNTQPAPTPASSPVPVVPVVPTPAVPTVPTPAPTVPSVAPTVPTVPTPANAPVYTQAPSNVPVYNPNPPPTPNPTPTYMPAQAPTYMPAQATNYAPAQPPTYMPAQTPVVAEPIDTSKDALVAAFTTSRFIASISLIIAAGSMYDSSVGIKYIIAGVLFFGSHLAEFMAEGIDMITFALCSIASFTICFGGAMAIDRRDIDINHIGIMWIVAAVCLLAGHSYCFFQSYKRINVILISSKSFAILGSFLFFVGGIVMYALPEDEKNDIYKYQSIFSLGSVCYLVHSISNANGHQAVLDRVKKQAEAHDSALTV
jgi:hypothetical protein